jgi:Uma2 family endonuclease
MAADPARRLPTFEELLAEIERLPEHLTGEILEPGVVSIRARPMAAHRLAHRECLFSLRGASADRTGKGWWIEHEPPVRFNDRLIYPDIAGWRVERSPRRPDGFPITLIPDWCCEVLSPSTARDDRFVKLPIFARTGVQWMWLIDPAMHGVEVYVTERGHPMLVATAKEDETTRLPPFDLDIDLSGWWLPTETPAPSSP